MKQITRHEAENLINTFQVVASNVVQDQEEMQIQLTLTDNRAFILRYNLHDHEKRYFMGTLK